MINTVIEGDYKNHLISLSKSSTNLLIESSSTQIPLSSNNIVKYDIRYTNYKLNFLDVIIRSFLGFLLLNNIFGLSAGLTATKSISYYIIYLEFNDGKKSLVKLNSKTFKCLAETIF